jgi:hypothetical protein
VEQWTSQARRTTQAVDEVLGCVQRVLLPGVISGFSAADGVSGVALCRAVGFMG